jgi:hypothetical protein
MLSHLRSPLVSSVAIVVIVVTFSLCSVARVRANDSVMGGRGSDLVPLANTDVVMESEDITLTYVPEHDAYEVVARYVFVNPSARELALQLGFPEYRCETHDPDTRDFCLGEDRFLFEGMQTRVRGEEVPQRKGRISKQHVWAPVLGGVWLFDVRFAAGERVPIEHRYRVPSGYDSSGGRSALYVTRTGALWAQPIGHARFTFVFPARSIDVIEPEGIPRTSYRIIARTGGAGLNATNATHAAEASALQAELVYEARDWQPKGDLSLYWKPVDSVPKQLALGTALAGMIDQLCPLAPKLRRLAYGASPDDPLVAQDEVSRERVIAELAALEHASLLRCHEYVLAAYGKPFEDRELFRAFYLEEPVSHGPLVPFEPNAAFTEALLSEEDRTWREITQTALAEKLASDADKRTRAEQRAAAQAQAEHGPVGGGDESPSVLRTLGAALLVLVALVAFLRVRARKRG